MSAKPASSTITAALSRFIRLEYSSGIFLLLSVAAAVLWANSAFADTYHQLWDSHFTLGAGKYSLNHSLENWVNDGLMAVFFFLIGLELKREFMDGELSTLSKAVLPMSAALGGMIVPALIYVLINSGTAAAHGWGIPMATDIAFALALLSMAGKHIPLSIKAFLSALAVADDLGAVLVIAFFYTSAINFTALGIAGFLLMILIAGNYFGVKNIFFYLFTGILVWLCFLLSGVHATIAGVLVAFTIPRQVLLPKIEHALHPWVAFGIMPVFALANSGIMIGTDFFQVVLNPVSLGVSAGLVGGKFAGILLFTWLMVKSGMGTLPQGAGWGHITGVALLGGIGFTMSLFISGLAFENPVYIDQAKYGILIGSVVAGTLGSVVLRRLRSQ